MFWDIFLSSALLILIIIVVGQGIAHFLSKGD